MWRLLARSSYTCSCLQLEAVLWQPSHSCSQELWSFDNFKNFFYSQVGSHFGIPSWIIGMALLITPFFGFETVPQMVEEGDFPIKDSNKAILGSIVSCGIVYSCFSSDWAVCRYSLW